MRKIFFTKSGSISETRKISAFSSTIAMVLENADIFLVSEMDPDFVKNIFLTPFDSAQKALDAAFERLGPDATVLAMPYGGSTLPFIK